MRRSSDTFNNEQVPDEESSDSEHSQDGNQSTTLKMSEHLKKWLRVEETFFTVPKLGTLHNDYLICKALKEQAEMTEGLTYALVKICDTLRTRLFPIYEKKLIQHIPGQPVDKEIFEFIAFFEELFKERIAENKFSDDEEKICYEKVKGLEIIAQAFADQTNAMREESYQTTYLMKLLDTLASADSSSASEISSKVAADCWESLIHQTALQQKPSPATLSYVATFLQGYTPRKVDSLPERETLAANAVYYMLDGKSCTYRLKDPNSAFFITGSDSLPDAATAQDVLAVLKKCGVISFTAGHRDSAEQFFSKPDQAMKITLSADEIKAIIDRFITEKDNLTLLASTDFLTLLQECLILCGVTPNDWSNLKKQIRSAIPVQDMYEMLLKAMVAKFKLLITEPFEQIAGAAAAIQLALTELENFYQEQNSDLGDMFHLEVAPVCEFVQLYATMIQQLLELQFTNESCMQLQGTIEQLKQVSGKIKLEELSSYHSTLLTEIEIIYEFVANLQKIYKLAENPSELTAEQFSTYSSLYKKYLEFIEAYQEHVGRYFNDLIKIMNGVHDRMLTEGGLHKCKQIILTGENWPDKLASLLPQILQFLEKIDDCGNEELKQRIVAFKKFISVLQEFLLFQPQKLTIDEYQGKKDKLLSLLIEYPFSEEEKELLKRHITTRADLITAGVRSQLDQTVPKIESSPAFTPDPLQQVSDNRDSQNLPKQLEPTIKSISTPDVTPKKLSVPAKAVITSSVLTGGLVTAVGITALIMALNTQVPGGSAVMGLIGWKALHLLGPIALGVGGAIIIASFAVCAQKRGLFSSSNAGAATQSKDASQTMKP